MPNNDNPLLDSETPQGSATPNVAATTPSPDATSRLTAAPTQESNLQRIQTNEITGPLVILFGPREIGKTVSLLRLCAYMDRYDITANESFRTDTEKYNDVIRAFNNLRQNTQLAPEATGIIDFLLLDVHYNGSHFCQILEAPGEHFFDRLFPNNDYPAYMNRILSSDYQKIFLLFFELNMFGSDDDLNSYCKKIATLVNQRIKAKRDRVIIVCNKADLAGYFKGGKAIKSEFQNKLYNSSAFRPLYDVLKRSGIGRVAFVPFSAGRFNYDATGKKVFTLAEENYAQHLWQKIHECISGRWWPFW